MAYSRLPAHVGWEGHCLRSMAFGYRSDQAPSIQETREVLQANSNDPGHLEDPASRRCCCRSSTFQRSAAMRRSGGAPG
eukprot:311822-Chlamydomonas_euryale.AAC.9